MLQFTRQAMKLTSINVRRELAGKDPASGRTASDLRLVVEGGNDILDKLDVNLRGAFYMADTDGQGVLLPHALTKRIHPLLKADALLYDHKCAGYQVTIDHAGNDESAIVRVEAHRIADEIVQGTGFERNGQIRACAVGCTLDAYDHSRYPAELGLPEWLARLEDTIHEGVPLERAKVWPGQFLAAIPVGVDVESVADQLAILRLERLLPGLVANKEPYARQCETAVRGMIVFLRKRLGKEFDSESAAWSAARSAWSAAAWEWEADTLLMLLARAEQ